MASYNDLAIAFKNKRPYRYNKELYFDGTRLIENASYWCSVQRRRFYNVEVVLAEWVTHNGKEFNVVYNRANKCYASDILWTFRWSGNSFVGTNIKLKYGQIGKPDIKQQVGYRAQMIDRLIIRGACSYILIPTSYEGDSAFFDDL